MKRIVKGAIFYADLKLTEKCNQKHLIPVLILQNNNDTTIIAPITVREYEEKKVPTHIKVKQFNKLRPNSIIMIDQIRTIDKKQLRGFVDILDRKQMRKVDNGLKVLFGFSSEYLQISKHNF